MTELEQEIYAVKQAAQDEATNRLLMEQAIDQRVAESLLRIFSGAPHAQLWGSGNHQYQLMQVMCEVLHGSAEFELAVISAVKSKLN